MVGRPTSRDVHFHDGEPLRFKAEFEVVPEIELGEYKDIEVPYQDPEVTDEDVDEAPRGDPRPEGAVRQRRSAAGGGRRLSRWWRWKASRAWKASRSRQDEMVLEIGGADTFEAFTENLRGLSPGRRKGVRSHLSRGLRRRSAWPARRSSSTPS